MEENVSEDNVFTPTIDPSNVDLEKTDIEESSAQGSVDVLLSDKVNQFMIWYQWFVWMKFK